MASTAICIAVSSPQLVLPSAACAPTDLSQVVASFMRGDPTSARINSALHDFATGRLTPPCNDCFISLVCPCCSKASDTAQVAVAVAVVAASTTAASISASPAATSQARVGAVQRSGSGGNGRGVLCSAAAVVLTDAGGESSHRGSRRQRGRSEKRRTQTR